MSDEQKRIRIAEACGWTCCGHVPDHEPHGLRPPQTINDFTTKQILNFEVLIDDIPDYLNDLNAMAAAEKTLPKELWDKFNDELEFQLAADPSDIQFHWQLTCRQRADAFLAVLGPAPQP